MDRGPFRARRLDSRPPAQPEPAPAPKPQPKEEPAVVREAPQPESIAPPPRVPKPEPIVTSNTSRHQASPRKESHVKAFYGHNNLVKQWALPVVSVIALIAIILAVIFGITLSKGGAAGINNKEYQAVFLQNGQDYFGKLTVLNSGYFKLTDVYYLQSADSSSTSSQTTSTSSSDNTTLVKLGSEIHAPEDEMIIAKDQVLFYENIKSSGKVAQAIAQYQKQNK